MKTRHWLIPITLAIAPILLSSCMGAGIDDAPRRRGARGGNWRIYKFTRVSRVYRAAMQVCKSMKVDIVGDKLNEAINGKLPQSWTGGSDVTASFIFDTRMEMDDQKSGHTRVTVRFYNVPAGGQKPIWAGRLLKALDRKLGF